MIAKITIEREHINLQGGWPTPRLHPASHMQAAATDVLGSTAIEERLKYGPEWGESSFRLNIAKWLTRCYKPSAGPITLDRILITNGASNSLATILQKVADPVATKNIWMVEPCYFLACPIFRDAGFADRIRAVPEGMDGVDLEYLKKHLEEAEKVSTTELPPKTPVNGYPKIYRHILYMVPTFSNPSGKSMSIDQRRRLVLFAREYDMLVIADDVYDLLHWRGDCSSPVTRSPMPRLVDIDRETVGCNEFGNVVSNGSFSKIVAPGTRVGWLEGTSEFVQNMGTVGATVSGGCQAHFASLIVNRLLESGIIESHIRDVLIPVYRQRRESMVAAIRSLLGPLGVRIAGEDQDQSSGQSGGFFLFLLFPDDGSLPHADEIARIALEDDNLRIAKGSLFLVTDDITERPQCFLHGARLCWAWHKEATLVEGIQRLASVLRRLSR